jgi:ribosomal protein L25 (general stress protein Ctc)
MKLLTCLSIIFLMISSCTNKDIRKIYDSEAFSIYSDKVVQENFEAKALSPTHLISNYQSPANESYSRHIEFKFSINGKDNELPPGVNHHLVLYPEKGKVISPVFEFGKVGNQNMNLSKDDYLEPNTELHLKVDFREVLQEFQDKGFYTFYNGEQIVARDFKGLYIAGGSEPLSWDFENLPARPQFQLKDDDNDGIYEITLKLNVFNPENFTASEWKLQKDISSFPHLKTEIPLVDALYNMSLEEALLCIRNDSTFMAGAKWEGVWTRDISYSIVLALAMIHPEISKNSLLKKVKNKKIIQDTGTGGSWPISTDRMTWAPAAWEIFKVTGDFQWLKEAYEIISNTAEDDLKSIFSPETQLAYGESSYLDWREQTYPKWMEPVDIFASQNLGTNAIHFKTYSILAEMSKLLGKDGKRYQIVADQLKKSINQYLWLEDKGYYGQYLYGRNNYSVSPKSEALGEALAVLYDITNKEQQQKVIQNTPVLHFGIPSIYPQIPGIPPYHNDGIWPFVQAYWNMATAKANNLEALNIGMASLFRSSALFLTNKENFVAGNGDFKGTQVNSDRQLWSVAGNLAMTYKVLFGINYHVDFLEFNPVIPKGYEGKKELKNLKYRNAELDVSVFGYGKNFKSIKINGKTVEKAVIPSSAEGKQILEIILDSKEYISTNSINLVQNKISPNTPITVYNEGLLSWQPQEGIEYLIYKDGLFLQITKSSKINIDKYSRATEFQIKAIDNEGFESFLSKPIATGNFEKGILVEVENPENSKHLTGFTGKGVLHLSKINNTEIEFNVPISLEGQYLIDFRYSNGNGPVNTDNKCGIRSLSINNVYKGVVVFPQRGSEEWSNWGYSNIFKLKLDPGNHKFRLSFEDHNNNMNGEINDFYLDHMRVIFNGEKIPVSIKQPN